MKETVLQCLLFVLARVASGRLAMYKTTVHVPLGVTIVTSGKTTKQDRRTSNILKMRHTRHTCTCASFTIKAAFCDQISFCWK